MIGFRHTLAMALLALGLGAPFPASSQEAPPPERFGISSGQADAILLELREIRRVLEKIEKRGTGPTARRRAPPRTVSVSVGDRPSLGKASAPLTMLEFTDFQCPFCRRFLETSFPRLREEYIDTGKLRWVVRDMPLGFHRDARKAAQAAHCAADQGKYWEMRALLFENNRALGVDRLPGYAERLGLDTEAFESCLGSEKHLDHIDKDIADAASVRASGTPTFVIGKTSGDTLKGKIIIGAQPLPVFEEEIKRLLEPAAAGEAKPGG